MAVVNRQPHRHSPHPGQTRASWQLLTLAVLAIGLLFSSALACQQGNCSSDADCGPDQVCVKTGVGLNSWSACMGATQAELDARQADMPMMEVLPPDCDVPCEDGPPGRLCFPDGEPCGLLCEGTDRDCNQDPADGCEVDTVANPEHCGECGVVCRDTLGESLKAETTCNAGTCEPANACFAGWYAVDGNVSNGCEVGVLGADAVPRTEVLSTLGEFDAIQKTSGQTIVSARKGGVLVAVPDDPAAFSQSTMARLNSSDLSFNVRVFDERTLAALGGSSRAAALFQVQDGVPTSLDEATQTDTTRVALLSLENGDPAAAVAVDRTLTLYSIQQDGSLTMLGSSQLDAGDEIQRVDSLETEVQGSLLLTWSASGRLRPWRIDGDSPEVIAISFPTQPIPTLLDLVPWYSEPASAPGEGELATGFATLEETADGRVVRFWRYDGSGSPLNEQVLVAERAVPDEAERLTAIGQQRLIAAGSSDAWLLSAADSETEVLPLDTSFVGASLGPISAANETLAVTRIGSTDELLLVPIQFNDL